MRSGMQAYVQLLGESNSVAALLGALVQLKRAGKAAPARAALKPGGVSYDLARFVWTTYMRQLHYRLSCLTRSYAALRQACAALPLSGRPGTAGTIDAQALAQRVCGSGASHAVLRVLAAGFRRKAVAEVMQAGCVIADAAASLLAASQKAAKTVREAFWKDTVSADAAAELSAMQGTVLAVLAQCAPAPPLPSSR